jgi:hypothetical protein
MNLSPINHLIICPSTSIFPIHSYYRRYSGFRNRAVAIMAATKTPISTDNAPKPLPGIYSQAIVANGMVYCSGAVPMDAETGKLIDGDIQAHTVRVLLLLACRLRLPLFVF